jgi:hypothetical protein
VYYILIKEKESKLAVAEMVSAYTFPQFLTPFFFFVGNPGGAVMSKKGQALNKNISIVRRFIQQFLATIKRQIISLLRTVFVTRKHQQAGNAGFVLPTVTMVSVVVVLLTTAIMFRSFDRAKNASNVRVNQMVMNSAAPAIDRAKAKLNKLFKDRRLSRATPTEREIDNVLVTYKDEYTFGDEKNLIVNCYDPSSGLNQGICSSAEILKTAWQFPIDTDNNGKFDSYTLYGIYYKNPALSGTSFVKRNPVQARAIPMTITSAGGNCPSTAISASLAGVNGWFKDNKSLNLVKGFFVYTVTVPITSTVPNNPTYEKASNSKGFSALEYEQDKIKRSLLNNAVIYQDDLYLTAEDADFKLNGGIFTNGNLLAGSTSGKSIKIYQVSSLNSCFYDPDNAKITVVNNIGTIPGANGSTSFDLFAGEGVTPTQTTSLTSARDRFSIAQNLDAGSTDRNGYWELAAAKVPDNPQDPVGGLRVVTGAGIYLRKDDTAPLANINFTAALPTIYDGALYDGALPEPPNSTSPPDANTPYLKMRASAVYHYKQAGYSQTAPKPIACVSSFYYDASKSNTKNSKNKFGLPAGFDGSLPDNNGLSNNGIVYGPPTKSVDNYQAVLNYQSTLKYNNGRSIDDGLLAGALAATNRTLSQQSTIDAAICALQILDGSTPTDTVIPHGAISEKKVETSSSTELDLGQLKGKTIGSATPSQEYLIPNSGIIYATRDDKNAIILKNGSDISRESNYRDAEKGLIVATNLPLYIKGDFNLHTQEEFNTPLNSTWSNFYTRSDRNPDFACRPNDPKLKINGVDSCPIGDKWRSAAVISDSITLLSNNYGSLPPSPAADTTTTYNAILVSGDTEQCGTAKCGLEDYVRFPENWAGKTAKISGIFMQQKKSIYDTSYTPNPTPPIRNWSYDVGILRQSPDLLAQKLIADTSDPPNEYFREVDRDDPWIQNLLCAKNDTNTSYIIDKNQRPSMCQS